MLGVPEVCGSMPRRNQRADSYVPLDLTSDEINHPPVRLAGNTREARVAQERRHRELEKRQRDARANQGIDWTVCLVPGCGHLLAKWSWWDHKDPAMRDHNITLPLCFDHAYVAHRMVERSPDEPALVDAAERLIERKQAQQKSVKEAEHKAWMARQDGEIYYLRLNGLIKVGWTRSFFDRAKAYGPDVEVLVVYPGTRDDETYLHRQLRPALAKGREWYHDGPIIQRFISEALERYGTRSIETYAWTTPKQVVANKRVRR